MARVVVTGGTGYIGSHTCVVLAEQGHDVMAIDNFSNSTPIVIERVRKLVGRKIDFCELDVRYTDKLAEVIFGSDVVIHFAASKSVGESLLRPLHYYDNNVCGTISLLKAMEKTGSTRLIYSSSAAVYGAGQVGVLSEDAPTRPATPYGQSKLMCEQIINDIARPLGSKIGFVSLRYFNPVGAHPSGQIGESSLGEPANLMPYLTQVAIGNRETLYVFGDDYATIDGTGVRDYVHVMDLAGAHAAAVRYLQEGRGSATMNIGTGRGYSVLELIGAFERVCGAKVPYKIVKRRPGDVDWVCADGDLAAELMGWRAEYDLEAMCRDAWRWQRSHPHGYGTGN